MTLLLLAAIGAVVVGFVLYPVLGREVADEQPVEKTQELKRLAEEKVRILSAIKDLDFEHEAGKLSDADYQRVRTEDLARAARVMARMESLTGGGEAPRQKETREPKGTSETGCPSCGQANPQNARFCLRCGNRLETKITCTKCGTELPGEARFCISCGEAIQT